MEQILNILASLGFNWHVALANFINFLIILFLLDKFFFKKIAEVINKRQEIIQGGLDNALKADRALASVTEVKKEIIKNAEKESHQIIVEAKTRAENISSNLKKETEKEISGRLSELKVKEQSLQDEVEKSFMKKAPGLVAKLYAMTLSREMTEKENNALLDRIAS